MATPTYPLPVPSPDGDVLVEAERRLSFFQKVCANPSAHLGLLDGAPAPYLGAKALWVAGILLTSSGRKIQAQGVGNFALVSSGNASRAGKPDRAERWRRIADEYEAAFAAAEKALTESARKVDFLDDCFDRGEGFGGHHD